MAENKNLKTLTLPNAQGELVKYDLAPKWEKIEGKPESFPSDLTQASGILPVEKGGTGNANGYIRTGAKTDSTIGNRATAEGINTTASGNNSHAEGDGAKAIGLNSHAEGFSTMASGSHSHAEGKFNLLKGARCKSGVTTSYSTTTLQFRIYKDGSNAEQALLPSVKVGRIYLAYSNNIFIGFIKIVNSSGSGGNPEYSYSNVTVECLDNTLQTDTTYDLYELSGCGAVGEASHAEGFSTSSLGHASHSEGCSGTLAGTNFGSAWYDSYSNIFECYGYNIQYDDETGLPTADFPPIDTILTLSKDAETLTDIQIRLTVVIGSYNPQYGETPYQDYEYELISGTLEAGIYYIYKDPTITQGSMSFGKASHAEGISTIASADGSHVEGKYNIEDTSKQYIHITGVGSAQTRANGFTINMQGKGSFASTVATNGADYAEHFEWLDGNPDSEDRIGYMVTLEGDKIKFANEEDNVIGIISGTAALLGDNAEWEWKQKYVTDDFGRIVYEHIPIYEYAEDEETHKIVATKIDEEIRPKLNPAYDPEQPYIARADRPEWDVVGMFGKLYVRDDGTSLPNQYLKVGNSGIGVNSPSKTNMRVLRRVSENIVQILFT